MVLVRILSLDYKTNSQIITINSQKGASAVSCTPAVVPGSGTLAPGAAALRCFCLLSWIISGSFGKNHESFDFLNVFCHLLMFKLSKLVRWWRFWRSRRVCSELFSGRANIRQEGRLRQEDLPLVPGLRSLVYLIFSSLIFSLVALALRSVAVKHPEIPLFLNNGEPVGSRKILRQLYSASVTR